LSYVPGSASIKWLAKAKLGSQPTNKLARLPHEGYAAAVFSHR